MRLVPCSACARHLRADEPSCPFCGAAVVFAGPTELPSAGPAMSRAAVLFVGATALAACGKTPGHTDDNPPVVDSPAPLVAYDAGPLPVAVYGPAPVASQAPPMPPPDAGKPLQNTAPQPQLVPAYGVAPINQEPFQQKPPQRVRVKP